MVVALDKIHEAGYRDINSVAEMLRAEIRRDKKAEKIMEEMKKYNSIAQVKGMKDAVSDSVNTLHSVLLLTFQLRAAANRLSVL